MDGDGLATGGPDGCYHGVCARLAGRVVHDHRSAFGGQRFGDSGSNALGRAGDDSNFPCELAHIYISPSVTALNFRGFLRSLVSLGLFLSQEIRLVYAVHTFLRWRHRGTAMTPVALGRRSGTVSPSGFLGGSAHLRR